MSDVPSIGLQDLSAPLTGFGRGIAETNATNARANLDQQQAQVAAQAITAAKIQNAQAQLSYDFRRRAVLDSMPISQNSDASGDNAGSNPSAPWWSSTPPQSGGPTDGNSDSPPSAPMGTLPGSPRPEPGDLGDSVYDHGRVDAGLRARYWVDPSGTPAEKQFLGDAALSGDKGLLDLATQRRNLGVESRQAQSQRDAGEMYDLMQAVATAPKGLAMGALDAISPQLSAAIRKKYANDPDAQDESARDSAAHIGASTHAYSGRELVADTGGTYRDKTSGAPVLGVPHAGMTSEQFSTLFDKANELVTVKNSDGSESQVPRWKSAGAASAAAYAHQAGDAWRATAMYPPAAQTALGTQKGKLDEMERVTAINNSQRTPQPGTQPATPTAPADPVLRQALVDPEYKLPNTPVIAGRTPSTVELEQQKQTATARGELLDEAKQATLAASQSQAYLQAARNILDSKGATLGTYGGLIAKLSAATPFTGDATNYQEVAKFLANAALQNAKQGFGKNFTQREVDLQLNQLSASKTMTEGAIRNITDTNMRANQYAIDSAKRARQYLASRGDPQTFTEWNEQYFPRAKAVNALTAPRSIVRTGTMNGRKVVQFSDGSTTYAE